MFDAENLVAAFGQQRFEVLEPEVDEVARDIEAVPHFAEEEELPAGSVGDLDDETPVWREELPGGGQIGSGIEEVLEYMKHGDHAATAGAQRRLVEGGTDGRDSIGSPGDGGGAQGEIKAEHLTGRETQFAEEETPAAPDVQYGSLGGGPGEGLADEAEMIAEDKPSPEGGEAVSRVVVRIVPVGVGIEAGEFFRLRPRVEADEAALAALDDVERLVGRAEEAVGAAAKRSYLLGVAGGTGIARMNLV